MLGIVHRNAVVLHETKYPNVQTNHIPKDINMLGKMVRLFLILGCALSAM